MKLVCLSDTHGMHSKVKIPDGDLLIHAGDACNSGAKEEFERFAEWFKSQTQFKHRIFVAGNHDKFVESNRKEAVNLLGPSIQYLQDSSTWFEDYHIYGSPWVPAFCDWAFNLDNDGLYRVADLIPEDLDILITHTPPHGLMDDGLRYGYDHSNIGSMPLALKLKQLHEGDKGPRYHIFGHNHCGYGVRYTGKGLSANVAICNERYNPKNSPIVFNLS